MSFEAYASYYINSWAYLLEEMLNQNIMEGSFMYSVTACLRYSVFEERRSSYLFPTI